MEDAFITEDGYLIEFQPRTDSRYGATFLTVQISGADKYMRYRVEGAREMSPREAEFMLMRLRAAMRGHAPLVAIGSQ